MIIKLIKNLFDSGQFVSHGHCYLWNPYLVNLHIVGDLLIALAYYSIPVMLFYFVWQRQDVPFPKIFLLFGAFIISCGTTHLMEIWTLWHPAYWLSGGLKIITAAVSLYTVSELFDLIPKALVLLSPAQWELVNKKLSQEIIVRQQSDEGLRQSRDELGDRVNERTKELTVANILLQAEIFERRQAEESLRHSEERYRSLILATTQINWTNSAEGRMTGEQPSWSAFTGQSYEEYQNFGWSEVIHPDDVDRTLASWNRAVSTQSLCEMEHRLCRHDGEYRYFSVRATPVLNADGSTREWVGAHTDITDRRRAEIALRESEQRLDWYSRHDGLTGLINRWEFEQHLKQALMTAKTYNQQHSLCFLDLDQFKIVNDTCGHAAGDELLRQVTALLQKQVRTTDTLARLGGDEFGLLLEQCPLSQSLRIANDLRQSLQEFRFIWQDKSFTIGVSIGLVIINVNTLDVPNLLSAADMACYAAKNAGRNRVHLYQAIGDKLRKRGNCQWWYLDRSKIVRNSV